MSNDYPLPKKTGKVRKRKVFSFRKFKIIEIIEHEWERYGFDSSTDLGFWYTETYWKRETP